MQTAYTTLDRLILHISVISKDRETWEAPELDCSITSNFRRVRQVLQHQEEEED